jgi:thiamine biosynthesis protein ThiS
MNIIVNGEERNLDGSKTVKQLIETLGLDGRKVAVERNMEIVPKSQYNNILLGDGDRLEIVHFIGGGAPDGEDN